jgi:hypothetical protein
MKETHQTLVCLLPLVYGVALLLLLLCKFYLVLATLPNTQPSPFTAYLPLALPQQRHQRQLAVQSFRPMALTGTTHFLAPAPLLQPQPYLAMS